jgi:hypothetical protein
MKVLFFRKVTLQKLPPIVPNQKTIEHTGSLEDMFYLCSEDKKLELVRNWLKRPPRALPKCYLDWVKQLVFYNI